MTDSGAYALSPIFEKNKTNLQKETDAINAIRVADVMNANPLTLSEDTTYQDALTSFRNHHRVNPIPIIDKERRVVGVISRYDMLKPLHNPPVPSV